MKRSPRFLFWLIILLTLVSMFINVPNLQKISLGPIKNLDIDPSSFLRTFGIGKNLEFRRGLDLEGGTSITFKAETSDVPKDQMPDALNSAKTVIEKRINLFGVSEPLQHGAPVHGAVRDGEDSHGRGHSAGPDVAGQTPR